MTAATFILHRYEDVSTVSGTGDVAWGVEWPDGAVAVRWPGDHPSTAVWPDIRDVEAIHGHGGKTVVQYDDPARLVKAYERIIPFLLEGNDPRPLTAKQHPGHPGCLRLTFADEKDWRFWIALLDGSSFTASHEEVNGEMQHTFVTSDGDVWLQWFSPLSGKHEHDLIHDPRD